MIEFVDIAGLVKGASKGEGLGNKFLSHIRNVDALIHVVRGFDNNDITHVAGSLNPLRDIQIIETELLLNDLERLNNRILKITKLSKSGDKLAQQELGLLETAIQKLNKGELLNTLQRNNAEKKITKQLGDGRLLSKLTKKKVVYDFRQNDLKNGGQGAPLTPIFHKMLAKN